MQSCAGGLVVVLLMIHPVHQGEGWAGSPATCWWLRASQIQQLVGKIHQPENLTLRWRATTNEWLHTQCVVIHTCAYFCNLEKGKYLTQKSTSSRENLRGGPQHHPGVHLAALQLPPNQTHCIKNIPLFSLNPDLQTSSRFTLDWWSFLPWLSFPPFWLFFAYFPSFENSKCLVIGKHWFQSRIISALTFTQTFTFFLFCWRFF